MGSSDAADVVVNEIKAAGGEAIANKASVSSKEGAQSIIDDAVSAFLYASIIEYDEIRKTSEITFNVASGVGVSVKDVFSLISSEVNKITGNKLQVKNAPWPKGVNEIEKRNFIGSAERLKLLSGWTPSVSLEDGVCSLVDHYSKEYI